MTIFEQIVAGLQSQGWHADGGGPQIVYLSRDEAALKVWREGEVIHATYTAEPPEADAAASPT